MPILPTTFHRSLSGLGVTNVTPTPQMQAMAQQIQTVEGYYPPGAVVGGVSYPNGSIAYQNNNPGNLRYAGQPGASPGANGYAVFDSYADGQQALYNQLNLYATGACGACNGQPLTLAQTMAIYAPASDGNNPTGYTNTLASSLGVDPNTQLSDVFNGAASSTPDSLDTLSPDAGSATDWTTLALVAGGALALMFLFAD